MRRRFIVPSLTVALVISAISRPTFADAATEPQTSPPPTELQTSPLPTEPQTSPPPTGPQTSPLQNEPQTSPLPNSLPASDLPTPPWANFGTIDIFITGLGLAGVVSGSIVQQHTQFVTTNPFDDAVARTLGITKQNDRIIPRDLSDLLLTIAFVYPVAVDALIFTAFLHHDRELAAQVSLLDGEAFIIAGGIQALTSGLTGRLRPYSSYCTSGALSPTNTDCQGYNTGRSFFSGHTTEAFTSAALTCVHHMQLRLYGGVADPVTCAAGLVLATATGLLRIVSDQHYATDVLVGAAVGLAVGFSVPLLIRPHRAVEIEGLRVSLVPTGLGVALRGDY